MTKSLFSSTISPVNIVFMASITLDTREFYQYELDFTDMCMQAELLRSFTFQLEIDRKVSVTSDSCLGSIFANRFISDKVSGALLILVLKRFHPVFNSNDSNTL